VGYGFDPADPNVPFPPDVPFRLDLQSSTFTSLPLLPGAVETQTVGINAAGTIVGGAFDSAGHESAFILDAMGGFTVFATPGWPNSEARAISSAGLIVGTSYAPDEPHKTSSVGFIYDPKQDTFTPILPGVSQDVVPQGINASGQVVGSIALPAGGRNGWLRAPNGDITQFKVNGHPTAARGINDTGQIAGFVIDPVTSIIKGFVTTLGGAPGYQDVAIPDSELIEYPGAARTYLEGITNEGALVGFWSNDLFPGQSFDSFIATPMNFQGLWWGAPANSESGWGLNLAHQGDTIFASWFTYDTSGRAWWLVMTASKTGPNTYSGTLYQTHGPAFNAVPWSSAAVTNIAAGTGTLVFSDANNGTFNYTVGAVTQSKAITREVFGALPMCTWRAELSPALATNYQDLWWNKPANSESGWGINLNHQGDTIFATWFTFDRDGTPLWLVMTANKTGPGIYSGDLYRTSGARFDAFNPANVIAIKVGFAMLTFADGNDATFDYTVQLAGMPGPVPQQKQITREVFNAPGTTCK
jgi:hypothetical protein